MSERRPPHDCPVCGETLALTRLSCQACGTELSGDFQACEFCALSGDERELLRVFLSSRGNMKELQSYLGVSYPTARLRFDGLLAKLGLDRGAAAPPPPADRVEVLQALARGEIDLGEAEHRLER
ncbi:MAG TPA: DUF2089 domain-containing protein [Actinomycetes bacterium]|jgi:hypothetical protein